MSPRARPAIMAVALLLLVVVAVTIEGYGPLAASEPGDARAEQAQITSPAAADAPATTGGAVTASAQVDPTTDPAIAAGSTAAKPLGALSEPDLPAFERSTVQLINLYSLEGQPTKTMITAARTACADLDRAVPLQAALRKSCLQAVKVAKLSNEVATTCPAQIGLCASAVNRAAIATRRLVATQRAYAKAVRANVSSGACRQELLPTHAELVGWRQTSTALQHLAVATTTGNGAARTKATADLAAATAAAQPDHRTPVARIAAFHRACHVARYPDPIS